MENVYILKFELHNQPHMHVVSGVVNLLSSIPGTALVRRSAIESHETQVMINELKDL